MDIVSSTQGDINYLYDCMAPILNIIRDRFVKKFKLSDVLEVTMHTNILKMFTHRKSLAEVITEQFY